ncbi:MAG: SOS response-associated peptidase [Acidimicrobiales bacterium]
MCGRIALYTAPDRLARIFAAQLALGIDRDRRPSFNIPPTRSILGVMARPVGADVEHRSGDGIDAHITERVIDEFRWGLIPSWAKDPSMGSRLFNARGETVASKPSFRSAFSSRRLVVPADGFYEWGSGAGKRRQPHYFRRADGQPLGLAGLWERWRPRVGDGDGSDGDPKGRLAVVTCTIITTRAGPDMEGIHPRMPVILEAGSFDAWLDPGNHERDQLEAFLTASTSGTLEHFPVDIRVGNVRNDGPELVEPRRPT